jgi:hypothetical protein
MFSHSGDENIEHNPLAHSWAELNADGRSLKRISIKKTVSESFMSDHATTGIFWFRRASDFLARLEETLCGGSHPPEHYLVDHVLQSCVDSGSVVSYVDVRYYCWGTPRDYETYHLTYRYWETYVAGNKWLKS